MFVNDIKLYVFYTCWYKYMYYFARFVNTVNGNTHALHTVNVVPSSKQHTQGQCDETTPCIVSLRVALLITTIYMF